MFFLNKTDISFLCYLFFLYICTMIIGYLAVFYGIIEIVILLRSLSVKRAFESQNPTYTATPIEDDIQDVEAEEVE